jgi:hypothetical protein
MRESGAQASSMYSSSYRPFRRATPIATPAHWMSRAWLGTLGCGTLMSRSVFARKLVFLAD